MDLWVVAAAAGAGYLAKYWQNIFRDSKSGFPSGSSVPYNPLPRALIQQRGDKSGPIGDFSSRKTLDQYFGESINESCSDGTFGENSGRDGPLTTEVASTSTLSRENQTEEFGEYERYEYEGGYSHRLGLDVSEMPENPKWDFGPSHMPRRRRNSWRSKRLHLQFINPLSSLESCVAAQMYREHTEMENYVLSSCASPCAPILRPFLVTDGKQLIGRASGDFTDGLNASDGVAGMPYLPRVQAADYSKQKLSNGQNQMHRTCNSQSRDGSTSGQFIFCLGISVGIMYAMVSQRLEVEKLKESLKQTENLVQDLQEELEMRDSLTVKELIIDDSSQDTHETSLVGKELNMFSSEVDTNVLTKHADDESASLKGTESISKIEAELEAELERLELSMNGTTLQGKLSGAFGQFDEDIAEVVQGELRTDLQRKSSSDPTPDQGSTPPSSVIHGVSPHELAMRLHDVIQSSLQSRINELEAELSKTQKRVQHLESEKVHSSWKEFWNSECESSSNASTPVVVEAHSPMAQQPVVMNLNGEALDAYNEACEELGKIKGFGNDDRIEANGHKVVSNGNRDEGSPDIDEGSPDCDDDDDDDDLRLIKQIIEKAKQGSPAVLRAQRALVHLERRE